MLFTSCTRCFAKAAQQIIKCKGGRHGLGVKHAPGDWEVCGANLARPTGFLKFLSLRKIRGSFYHFATKRRWISREDVSFKISSKNVNVKHNNVC